MTKVRPTLTLTCATWASDNVTLVHHGGVISLTVTETISIGGDKVTASIDLNEATARELFNWLGVQLHKGGWGT